MKNFISFCLIVTIFFIYISFSIIVGKAIAQECTEKVCTLPEYHDVEAWSANPNRTANITIDGEIGVYCILEIEPCTEFASGWVLRTDDDNPWCYTIGPRVGTMVEGQFVPFIEKTYPF